VAKGAKEIGGWYPFSPFPPSGRLTGKMTLFMLVSALMGLETMHQAYRRAIKEGYRFYSYGDSSLLLPKGSAERRIGLDTSDVPQHVGFGASAPETSF